MFKNQRYATCGVNARIPLITQIMLWGMIDSLQAVEKDYLQIFRLSDENGTDILCKSNQCDETRCNTHTFRN